MSRQPGDAPRRLRPGLVGWLVCVGVALLVSTGTVLLRHRIPVALLRNSGYDDALFVRQATHLRDGQWLGPFDSLTLSKGPAYPAFIAGMHATRIPLKVGEQLTFLLAVAVLAACVWVVTRRKVVATAVFVILAVDPASFGFAASRVLRDSWYASLALLLLGAFFLAVHGAVTRTRLVWLLPTAVLAGLSAAAFWLCREEGPAIAPPLAVIALGVPVWALVRGWSARSPGPVRRRRLFTKTARVTGVFAVVAIAALIPIGYVARENASHYGVGLTNDVSAGAYARAYADWADVDAGAPIAQVPINAAQRAAVYAISPAANELSAELESPANHWRATSCHAARICADFGGAWEVWALREAAADAGHFGSETAVQSYFGRIADDIETACAQGRLSCQTHLPPSLEPFQHATVSGVWDAYWRGLVFVTTSTVPTSPPVPRPAVSAADRKPFAAMIVRLPTSQRSEAAAERRFAARADWYDALSSTYRWLAPLLVLLGIAGLVLRLLSRTRTSTLMCLLAIALAVGGLFRLLLLAVIDSTTFSTVGSAYQLTTRTLLIAFGLTGAAVIVERLSDLRSARQHQADEVSLPG